MKYKIIKTEEQYEEALERLNEVFEANEDTDEGQEAELLALLIENYEEENYPIRKPDPIVAIKIRMDEMKLKQKDLIGILGSKGIVSEVLSKKRKLTVKMIRNISERLKITPEILIQDYDLH